MVAYQGAVTYRDALTMPLDELLRLLDIAAARDRKQADAIRRAAGRNR